MYELCQQYPDITLGQLMATLDSQPRAAHSEAVQTLLRFRDNPWSPAEDWPAQSDKETRESTEVSVNPPQAEALPDHSRGNRRQQPGAKAKPSVATNNTRNEKTTLIDQKKGSQPLANTGENSGRYRTAGTNTPESLSVLGYWETPVTTHNTRPNNHPAGYQSHGRAASLLSGLSFAGLWGSGAGEGRITDPIRSFNIITTLDDVMCRSLTVVCKPSSYFVQQGITSFGQALEQDGRDNQQASDFCEHFCVTSDVANNDRYNSWPSEILNSNRCLNAETHIHGVFSSNKAQTTYGCVIYYDSSLHFCRHTISQASHDCIDEYAKAECIQLKQNFADPASNILCYLCDAAKDSQYHCTPLPRAVNPYRLLRQDKSSFENLSDACDRGQLPELCDQFCISKSPSGQARYQEPWARVLGDHCKHAANHINRLIYMDRAAYEYGCTIYEQNNRLYLDPDSGNCLLQYATQECTALHNNGTRSSESGFCKKICTVAKNPLLSCDASPNAPITGLWSSSDETISLEQLCEGTTHQATHHTTLCDHFCITQTLANNDRYRQTDWANLVGPTRCAAAHNHMTQLFPVDTLIRDSDCEVIYHFPGPVIQILSTRGTHS